MHDMSMCADYRDDDDDDDDAMTHAMYSQLHHLDDNSHDQ